MVLSQSIRASLNFINKEHCAPERWLVQRHTVVFWMRSHTLSLKIPRSSHPGISVQYLPQSIHWQTQTSGATAATVPITGNLSVSDAPGSWGVQQGSFLPSGAPGLGGSHGTKQCVQSGVRGILKEYMGKPGEFRTEAVTGLQGREGGREELNLNCEGRVGIIQVKRAKDIDSAEKTAWARLGDNLRWAGSGWATAGKPEEPNPARSQTMWKQIS